MLIINRRDGERVIFKDSNGNVIGQITVRGTSNTKLECDFTNTVQIEAAKPDIKKPHKVKPKKVKPTVNRKRLY